MKTFNCTQCGASIRRISLKDKSADCEYCKAKFLLPEEKRPVVTGLSFGEIRAGDPDSDGPDLGPLAKAVGVALLLGIIVFGGIKAQEQLRAREESERKASVARVRDENRVTNVPVSVEWEGAAHEVVHYELPVVDTIAFALARQYGNAGESKQVVVVRVKIDRDGSATEAELVSGSAMLQLPATKAARATSFSPDLKKKVRNIIYTFG